MTEDLFSEDEFEVEGTMESEQDLPSLKPLEINQAVVTGTDWTVETILSQINKGNIVLNPKFQRRDAWRVERKSKFIESLILGFPVPQIVLAEIKGKKGTYIVIDGKQRLLSIRQFAASKSDSNFTQLRLKGLELLSELKNKSYSDLQNNPDLLDDLRAFENAPIRTIVIKNWFSESFLYYVFLRLNTGSVPLSPQELRQALHPGPFVDFADETASNSPALREILKTKGPDFRMRDVELLIRFYAFHFFLSDYTGNMKTMLDDTCENLNLRWSEEDDALKNLSLQFEEAYLTTKEIFGEEGVFRKWNSGVYEKKFNRAIFDVMMHYFAEPQIRQAALSNKKAIEDKFKMLCMGDRDFLSAIERTTKSLGATYTRFSKWAIALSEALKIEIHIPVFENGRIV